MVLEGVHLVPGMLPRDRGRARRPVRARDRATRRSTHPLLGPRRGPRRPAAASQVPRPARRHPARSRTTSSGARARHGVPVIDEQRHRARRSTRSSSSCWRAPSRYNGSEWLKPSTSGDVGDEQPPSRRALCLCEQYVRVTEGAALTAARWLGRADQEAAERDAAAGDACRARGLPIDGRVVIGAADGGLAAPRRPATIGAGGETVDLALDPLEGRGVVARGGNGAMSMIAVGERGSLLDAAGHVHAQDGGRSARARLDRPAQADRRERRRRSPMRSAAGRTTSRRSSSTGRATTT